MPVVLYGIGSPMVVDVEESCRRLGIEIVARVKNIAGSTFGTDTPIVEADDLSESLTAVEFLSPIFTPGYRRAAVKDAQGRGFHRPATIVDPTAVVASSTTLAAGSYVNCGVTIGGAGKIGQFVFVNRSASIGHHVEIAEFASIGPGVTVAGNVRIGRGAVLGVGSVVLPGMEIGANSVVGAGAVVTKAVPPHSLVIGNPAKVSRAHIAGYKDMAV